MFVYIYIFVYIPEYLHIDIYIGIYTPVAETRRKLYHPCPPRRIQSLFDAPQLLCLAAAPRSSCACVCVKVCVCACVSVFVCVCVWMCVLWVLYEHVMSHIWKSHVTRMNESRYCGWLLCHAQAVYVWMSNVEQMNESCHTYEHVMSHL